MKVSSTQPPSEPNSPAEEASAPRQRTGKRISPADAQSDIDTLPTKIRRRSRKQLDLDRGALELELLEETLQTQKLVNLNQELENRRFRFDLYLRLIAAVLIPAIVIFWLVRVLNIVSAQQSLSQDERLSDVVLSALLGTTSITVIGMMSIVARYLFTQPIARTSLPAASVTSSINY